MPQVNPRKENRIVYPSFAGGLNLSVPPESLGVNELTVAENVEYSASTGAMTVRGGLMRLAGLGMESRTVAALPGRRGFIAAGEDNGTRYFTWNRVKSVTGSINGREEVSVAKWDDCYLLASGGKLQKFTDRYEPRITTIAGSPDYCRMVFVHNGRVGVVTSGNMIRFSAVGDCASWGNDPEDESTGQYVEVGYKDGMSIDAVIPLSRDLIVFKSPEGEPDKGTIFRLTGDYPDWSVLEVAHNTGTYSPRSVQAVGNDVYYVGVTGLASLSAVTSYGDIQATWPDKKVNAVLRRSDAELWHIPAKQQLWLKAQKGTRKVWVLDYGAGIWTEFKFPAEVKYADGSNDMAYVFMGNNVYGLMGWKADDDVGMLKAEIVGRMRMGTILTGNQVLVKRAFVSFRMLPENRAELMLGKFRMSFSHEETPDRIYDAPNDTQKASEDEDPLIDAERTVTSRRQCLVRGWTVTPEVKMTGGGCALSTMALDIAEV